MTGYHKLINEAFISWIGSIDLAFGSNDLVQNVGFNRIMREYNGLYNDATTKLEQLHGTHIQTDTQTYALTTKLHTARQ